ncbi:serine hydrolase domain-containing protein [Acinetobacter indicus]|uniref:serine hydrolase domain-containing protein n=1 Tax=Acinetobacter indicus TaxID=756892 RepID=UPI00136309E1|nr:serine hydrolase domain-containing protein [Acinetobacter indicus]
MSTKSMKLQKKDVLILLLLIILLVVGTYWWTNYPLKVERAWYWVQYPLIKRSIHCSDQAPSFMHEIMLDTIKQQKTMSNQVAYLSPNGQLHHCESGWEDGFMGERKITDHSRFLYASLTKVVTSAMILDLIDQEKIHLDQPILEILPVPEPPQDPRIEQITVEMLLQHSAGFDRQKTLTPMMNMGQKPWCPTQLNELANVKLDFEPNTQFKYSNLGYCLLGAIIEEVTGLSYRTAVEQKYQLSSYQMKFINNDFLPDEIQYDYRNENFYTEFWRSEFDFKDSLSAVGGLSGSATQLLRLIKKILDQQNANILQHSKIPCANHIWDGCYGYAMDPYQATGQTFTVYHRSGYFPGVGHDLFVDDRGGVLVILRGATTAKHISLNASREQIYKQLLKYYKTKL